MPYQMPDNIPDYIKGIPEGAQAIFVDVFNSTLKETNDEEKARMAGWGAVKNSYEKVGDAWQKKAADVPDQLLRYVANLTDLAPGDGAAGTKMSQVQVFRTGVFRHPTYGKFTITDDDLAHMEANFKANRPKPPTELVVDYEHMSLMPGRKAPAAGWVKAVEHRTGELVATIEWTPAASGHIANREYRFISPEWNMHYKDKESGKDIGPCLMSMALTNRPFFEGMRPVIASERLEADATFAMSERVFDNMRASESMDETSNVVRQAFYAAFPQKPQVDWLTEVYATFVIGESAGEYFQQSYARDANGKVIFGADRIKVKRIKEYTPIAVEPMQAAEWDTSYMDDLPDKSFAYIAPGGEKDKDGNTVPRSLRHLPYRKADGAVDLPHLRNALARLDQTSLPTEAKAQARATLDEAAKAAGVSEARQAQKTKEENQLDEKRIRELLGIDDKADIMAALTALVTDAKAAKTAKDQADAARIAKEVDADVKDALDKHLILPKQEAWAKSMRAKDPEGFKAFVATAQPVGPEMGNKGKETAAEAATLTATEEKVGNKLGVSKEDMLKQKQRDAANKAA